MIQRQTSSALQKHGLLIASVTWWFFWLMLQWIALQDMGVDPVKGFVDALLSNLVLAVLCWFVIRNMNYYLPGKERYIYVVVISAALSAIWLLLVKFILKMLYRSDEIFIGALGRTGSVRYGFAFLMLSCAVMLGLLWFTQKEQREDNERQAATERLAREAELNKLRQQLQPHFLFNSLNSISALTGTQPEKARHMIQQLADFLRGTLKKEEQQWTNFEEELVYLRLYLDIEQVRFGYRLQTRIDYEAKHLPMKIPVLILQPIVENAIKFGLYDTTGEVEIRITVTDNGGILQINVQNPFDEDTASPRQGTGFGLSSIQRRLYLLFGRNDLLAVSSDQQIFSTILRIPQI